MARNAGFSLAGQVTSSLPSRKQIRSICFRPTLRNNPIVRERETRIRCPEGLYMPTESLITDDRPEAALIDVRAVARMLDCSTRHVYCLADASRMPAPVRLGALVRWNRAAVELVGPDGFRQDGPNRLPQGFLGRPVGTLSYHR